MAKGQGRRAGGRSQARNSQRNGLRGSGRDGNREARGRERDARAGERRGRKGPRGGAGGGNLIEGRRAVAEALFAGIPIRRAFVQRASLETDDSLAALVAQLKERDVEVEETTNATLASMSSRGAHQGIVVKVEPFAYASLADIIRASGTGDALVIVLDHITDEGNFGAIIRSAEVVGASGVVVPKTRSASVGVGAYKTSAGAVLHIPIAQVSNIASTLEELKEAGFWVVGATEHAQDSVWDSPMEGRIALVMGSEDNGISRLVLEKCDLTCKLPQRGKVESLNVAQATTVMAYEWARRSWGSATDGVDGADG